MLNEAVFSSRLASKKTEASELGVSLSEQLITRGYRSLTPGGLVFDHVICAYALHLCDVSRLPGVCLALAAASPNLHVITPHKRPVLREAWGWVLEDEHYDPGFRVRTRSYRRR